MTEHNDPILQEALNDLADIQFCDNDHNQAVEEERQCENIILVMASKYADEIDRLKDENDRLKKKNVEYVKSLRDVLALISEHGNSHIRAHATMIGKSIKILEETSHE